MTAAEFLQQLETHLCSLTAEERESALSYYREYLEEAGEDAASAIEALGSPQSVAQRIISEVGSGEPATGFRYTAPRYSAPPPAHSGTDIGRIALTIIVILVTFPIWFTVLTLWVSLLFSLAVILLTFAFAAVVAPIQGILFFREGLVGSGLWDIGGGLVCLGLGMLLWQPFLKACTGSTKGLFRLTKKIIASLLGKEERI